MMPTVRRVFRSSSDSLSGTPIIPGPEHSVDVMIQSPSVRRDVANPSELSVHAFHPSSESPRDLVAVHAKPQLSRRLSPAIIENIFLSPVIGTPEKREKDVVKDCSVNTDEPRELLGLDLKGSGISDSGRWEKRPGSDLGMRTKLALLGLIDPFSTGIEGLWLAPPILSIRRCRYPCRECQRARLNPGLLTNRGGSVLLTGHTPPDMGCAFQLRAARLDAWLCRDGSVGVYRSGSSASA
ncbi:hypothetical protein U1Q18_021741 [Sarracenia purpurea var. burkii]